MKFQPQNAEDFAERLYQYLDGKAVWKEGDYYLTSEIDCGQRVYECYEWTAYEWDDTFECFDLAYWGMDDRHDRGRYEKIKIDIYPGSELNDEDYHKAEEWIEENKAAIEKYLLRYAWDTEVGR